MSKAWLIQDGNRVEVDSLNGALESALQGDTVEVRVGGTMDAQSFGKQKNSDQDELTRLSAFLAQMENMAYQMPQGSQARKDILAKAHEARGLKPAKDERVIIAEQ